MKAARALVTAAAALAVAAGIAAGQPAPTPAPGDAASADEPALTAPPIVWAEWEIVGPLIDAPATVRALLEPELRKRRALTPTARAELEDVCERLGYQLVDLRTTRRADDSILATLELAPIPVVRWVDVAISQTLTDAYLDDEVRRRLRLRPGVALPRTPALRQQQLDEEAERVQIYLRDEGYFEASVTIGVAKIGAYGARVTLTAKRGPAYRLGKVRVVNASQSGGDLSVSRAEIARVFEHEQLCLSWAIRCAQRFTRAQHQADLEEVTRRFQRRGFPAVRVTSDFDPATSFDRKTHTVDLTIRIDERRKLDVVFEGNDKDAVPDEELTKILTFSAATSVDDFEIAASARAIERTYQERGNFDVLVSYERVRFRAFDRVVYRIEPGSSRDVRRVALACRGPDGERPCSVSRADVLAAIGTREPGGFLSGGGTTTTEQLAYDVAAIERLYQGRGFLQARASVEVAPTPAGWGASAVALAELAVDRAPHDLHVRFRVDEGPRTLITEIHFVFEGAATGGTAATEAQVRARFAVKAGDPFVQDRLNKAAVELADWYWNLGRPRAKITFLEPVLSADGKAAIVTVNVEERQELRIGEVVVRGNFRTRDWVVKSELGFGKNQLLTGDLYRGGPTRLRATNLFASVQVGLVDFEETREGTVDVVVRVEERRDAFLTSEIEGGGSLETGWFLRPKVSFPNISGWGMRLDTNVTAGTQYQAAEATLRVPHWVVRHGSCELGRCVSFDTEVTSYVRNQTTERFGDLFTYGGSVALSRSWQRENTERHRARSIAAAVRYDVRLRSRDEELTRPAGPAGDLDTNPIRTRTGTLGVTLSWDQRRDPRGNLNPLAPDNGFRAEVGAAWAAGRFTLSQDSFVKLSGLGQAFYTNGRVQLRVDGRYDHGIPLGGAVLLPEVERFFAGGDTSVRGYEEDRLLTEIIRVPVPPLGQTTQIRVLPAGGNIRALGTLDAQVTLWRAGSIPIASAIFVDAGLVTNTLAAFSLDDVRPAAGMAARLLLPIGTFSGEYAVPLRPRLGDDPRGRFHFVVALRY